MPFCRSSWRTSIDALPGPRRRRRPPGLDHVLRDAGVPGWSAFLAAVRVDLLLDGAPPLLIAHRAGRVSCAVVAQVQADGASGRPLSRPTSQRHRAVEG
jgi:hypothetical protein